MKGKHVLITGHTGFKGSWLIAMLHHQGAKVSGIALDPAQGGIFDKAALHELLAHDIRLDIRDSVELTKAIKKIAPDVVIHLAAQPLVISSYGKPLDTYVTNVIGTLNVLHAIKETSSVNATLIVTTDKVYKQQPGEVKAFDESCSLGAADPYSTSKAMADLLTQSWISSHPESKIAIARAGNVIGGGDVAENRLLPDLVRAFQEGTTAIVRNPRSVRPWQHVLDCLSGYVSLAEGLLSGVATPGIFNFGPDPKLTLTVGEVADIAVLGLGGRAGWRSGKGQHPQETLFLTLDSSKSQSVLGWSQRVTAREAIHWTTEWSVRVFDGESALELTMSQISKWKGRSSTHELRN